MRANPSPPTLLGRLVPAFVPLRPRPRVASLVSRYLLAVALAGGFLAPGAGVAEEPATILSPSEREQVSKAVDAALSSLEAAQAELPRESFDPRAIVDAVGRDPAKLAEWVKANTTGIAYRGALRGPRGVLMDRMGNSLDRSLLLAELMLLAGYEVRLARADLDPVAAGPLPAPRARPAAPGPAGEAPSPGPEGKADPVLEQVVLGLKNRADEAARRVAEDSGQLLAALAGKLAPGADGAGEASNALRDDWWVQAQVDGNWVDWPLRDAPAARPRATIDVGSLAGKIPLPSAECHELYVSVVIEQWAKGRTREIPILKARLRPAEELGRPIAVSTYPTRFAAGTSLPGKDLATELTAVVEWTSVLTVGPSAVAVKSFNDAGEVVGKPSLGLQQPGGAMGGLGGMLGGGEEPPARDAVLSAVWIDFEIRAPQSKPRSLRREVFDLIGPAARAAGNAKTALDDAARLRRACALGMRIDVLALPCQPTDAFVRWQAAANLREHLEALRAALGKDPVDGRDVVARVFQAVASAQGPLYDWALSRKDFNPRGEQVALTGLNVVDYRTGVAVGADGKLVGRAVFDVAANEVGVPFGTGPAAAETRLLQGVADTVAEGALASGWSEAQNTSQLFALAREQKAEWCLLAAGQEPPASLDPDVRARLLLDLPAGFAALMPGRAVDIAGRPRIGWWRVDLTDGSTVGVMDSGLHETTEDLLMRQVLHWMLRLRGGGTLLPFARIATMPLTQFLVYCGYRHGPGMQNTYRALVALHEGIQAVSNLPFYK